MNPPGRFLDKGPNGSYTVKDKNAALKKIKKALSEHNQEMIENLKKIGQMQPISRKQSETVQVCRNQRRKRSEEKVTKEDWVKLCQTLNGLPDDLPHKRRGLLLALQTNDVISGPKYFSHSGNQFFLSLINANKKYYILAKEKSAQAAIVRKVFDQIQGQSPPGRFIKKNAQEGVLMLRSKNNSLRVIEKALSENKHVILQYLNKEKKGSSRLGSFSSEHQKVVPLEALSKTLSTLKIKG
jgi:hypothetical protein